MSAQLVPSLVAATVSGEAGGIARLTRISTVESSVYVPGATAIYIQGTVLASSPDDATFRVLNLLIVTNGSQPVPPRGSVVEIVGIQPSPGGAILSSTLHSGSNRTVDQYVADPTTDHSGSNRTVDQYVADPATDHSGSNRTVDQYAADPSTDHSGSNRTVDQYVADPSADHSGSNRTVDQY
jgi:hypothetical protein